MSFQSDIASPQVSINSALWRHRLLLSIVVLHLVAGLGVSVALDVPFKSQTFDVLRTQFTLMIPIFLVMLLFWRFGWMAVCVRPDKPIHWFVSDMRRILLDPDRIAMGALAFLCVALFAGTFVFLKASIPMLVPYSWDPAFAALDRALHFGHDPWTLLMPFFGTPAMTEALNYAYNLWFFLMYFFVLWTCFDTKNIHKSTVFLIAYLLVWSLGGNFAATALSSVGPVYYEAMGFGDTFVPQMESLYAFNDIAPISAITMQEMLLDGYLNDGPIQGISAMPSMHVGSTTIMMLYCFGMKRWLGWVMLGFLVVIQIGSVHLAWHYAIDGYFAIVMALGLWWLAQRLTDRFGPQAA